ncbi:piggyBac transposable element-derived protein 4-like [Oscarella lobularis]|uniref:piggyBac transposable element-derived protein 4-like n=1 Tax=Oscarella lobularis TaxID=121494 RepID=UPI003313671C
MIPYKGRLGYKQDMKDKPTKWGIKVFILAKSSTGYVYKFDIYTGKKANPGEHGLSTQIVLDLTEGMDGKRHVLYTDIYYSSPTLFDLLWDKNLLLLDDGTIPTTKRQDGRNSVNVECPPLLEPYNANMRGVDRGDQITALYDIGRKSRKPWRRIAFYLLEAAVLNAFIVEKRLDPEREGAKRDFRSFRLELGVALVGKFSGKKQKGRKRQRPDIRLDTSLSHLPISEGKRLQCVCCSEKA